MASPPPWLHCICVVKFDLEFGQAMEIVQPESALTEKEKMAICYLSLPDSNSGCLGDTQFHFRLKTDPKLGDNWSQSVSMYNEKIPAALQAHSAFYFGFVFFRQVKDKTVPRGYMQKMTELIASEYFDTNDKPSLDQVYRHISELWPYPDPGKVLNLPLCGVLLQVRLPSRLDSPVSPTRSNQELMNSKPVGGPVVTLASAHETSSYEFLLPILSHVQTLWELVLCEEPIVVMAQSPTVCASVVQSLAGFIYPLACTDYRPFFTIHDCEFKDFTRKSTDPPKLILGVTNPFFTKTLQHWPHIVRLCDSGGNNSPASSQKLKKTGNLKTLDSQAGVYTRYKAYLKKDKAFLKRLVKGIQLQRPVEVQNALLRRHFSELTESFMIPLERHMASHLMPLKRNISPFKDPPVVRSFDVGEFLSSLEVAGPQLTSGLKGDWLGLYRRFFDTQIFKNWLIERQAEVNLKLRFLHAEIMCHADLLTWANQNRSEVELIEYILKLKTTVAFMEANNTSPSNVRNDIKSRLLTQKRDLMEKLSADVRQILI